MHLLCEISGLARIHQPKQRGDYETRLVALVLLSHGRHGDGQEPKVTPLCQRLAEFPAEADDTWSSARRIDSIIDKAQRCYVLEGSS